MGHGASRAVDFLDRLAREGADDQIRVFLPVCRPDHRFGLVDYKDFGDIYQARLDVGFTTNVAALQTGVNAMIASGGGDTPESVYAGIMKAFEQPWRPGVKKVVIVIGDAPAKDPEPGTGYTAATVINRAFEIDPAVIYALQFGNDSTTTASFTALTSGTGGAFQSAANLATFHTAVVDAIKSAAAGPLAAMAPSYTGVAGLPVTFSAATSTPGDAPIQSYAWDFNGDGIVEETTTAPTTSHVYATAGNMNLRVRVTDSAGLASFATATVAVSATPLLVVPGSVVGLTATTSPSSVTLRWSNGVGATPLFYVISDDAGAVIDIVAARPDGTPPASWTDPALPSGTALTYRVAAGNIAGVGPATPITFVVGNVPSRIADCQNDGWRSRVRRDGTNFKIQGDCIQYVNTSK